MDWKKEQMFDTFSGYSVKIIHHSCVTINISIQFWAVLNQSIFKKATPALFLGSRWHTNMIMFYTNYCNFFYVQGFKELNKLNLWLSCNIVITVYFHSHVSQCVLDWVMESISYFLSFPYDTRHGNMDGWALIAGKG